MVATSFQVQWADALGVDANVNSLKVDVDGGLARQMIARCPG